MESLKKSLKYQFNKSKKFIMKLWLTLILLNIFLYLLNYLGSHHLIGVDLNNGTIGFSLGDGLAVNNPVSVAGVNIMIIAIVLLVYHYESNYEKFPLMLSLSVTRKDYFMSFLINNIALVFIFASIEGLLLKIDPLIMKSIGLEPLYDFRLFNLKTDTLLFVIATLFVLFLVLTSIFDLLSSLNYKFGYKIWIVIVGLNIILSLFNLGVLEMIILKVGDLIGGRFGVSESLLVLVSLSAIYIINYFVTINSDVKRSAL